MPATPGWSAGSTAMADYLVDVLDQSLGCMALGEPLSQCVVCSPEYADQLLPLLQVAQILRHWASLTAREEAFERGYARTMAAVDARLDSLNRLQVAKGCLELTPEMLGADRLAQRILGLDEPWRSRFIAFVLSHCRTNGVAPPDDGLRQELVAGLLDDELYPLTAALLQTWCHD